MPRKQDDMAGRLQTAALELFGKRGYDRTTAAEIAAQAGVTERTFFRYFPDKREVLFGGQELVLATLTAAVGAVPPELNPLETLFSAFRSILPLLEANRPWLTQRHATISATPALHEREVTKMIMMGDALAAVLEARGIKKLRGIIAARVGMTLFGQATSSWLNDDEANLNELFELTLQDFRALLVQREPDAKNGA